MQWWSQLLDLLVNNIYFRSGFLWGLIMAGAIWMIWGLCFRLYVRWLKIRQFFEPIKKPGKVPMETGSSPAGLMLGCLWQTFVMVIVLTIILGGLIWISRGLYS